jgi:hypothetical protein
MHSLRPRRLALPTLALALVVAGTLAQPAAAFHDRDCADFATHRQAQRFFEKHNPGRDPHNLDGDNDGRACEDLP